MITLLLLAQILGFFSAFHALMSTRTSQGTIAWIVALNTFPVLTVPVYWVLGRNKFQGYVTLRRQVESKLNLITTKAQVTANLNCRSPPLRAILTV